MSKLIQALSTKDSFTANGAITHSTSLNAVLDLFFIAGASRTMEESVIQNMLVKAYAENKFLTLKVIFWAGDIRGGQGERRFLRIALKWLETYHNSVLEQLLHFVPEFNRWDSLFELSSDKSLQLIHKALADKNQLCAKWMPRKKQYDNFASKFRKRFGLTPKQYRQLIVENTNVVETQMCKKEWSEIEYKKIPSVAFSKYRKAWARNDGERFKQFIDDVNAGKQKIHASVIFPHDIYKSYKAGGDESSINAQWNCLPNYLENSEERILPVCDVSGSMTGTPMDISVSLGLYFSERNKSVFKDAFITFSETPKLHHLKGELSQRIKQLESADWGMSTNLVAVFELILNAAVTNKLSNDDLPTMIVIISDMEFNMASKSQTNFEFIDKAFAKHEYIRPSLIFWNVNGRENNVPVNKNDKNVALVSGCSPVTIKSILSAREITPVEVMMTALNDKRYDCLEVCG
jgi:AraC-like DNA-binding protein